MKTCPTGRFVGSLLLAGLLLLKLGEERVVQLFLADRAQWPVPGAGIVSSGNVKRLALFLQKKCSRGTGYWTPEDLASLLKRASNQSLVNILKEPFTVGPVQKTVLKAIELKSGEKLDGDLWRFVAWATSPAAKDLHLDLKSSPRLEF
jgi:hypothetical protein